MSKIKAWFGKNTPTLLTLVGVVGFGAAVIFTAKQTPKAEEKLEEKKKELKRELTVVEKVKTAAPVYAVPLVLAGSSTVAIFAARNMFVKKEAAAITAYTVTNESLKALKSNLVQVAGQDVHDAVMDAVAKEEVAVNPIPEPVTKPDDGKEWVFDAATGEYFRSTMNEIEAAVNQFNAIMLREDSASINTFRELTGRTSQCDMGDILGRHIDQGLWELRPRTTFMPNGIDMCIVLDYIHDMGYGFDSVF